MALVQAGQTPQESVSVGLLQRMYCEKAKASGNDPVPSLPRNNNAWLNLLSFTSCTSCALTDRWPIIFSKSK